LWYEKLSSALTEKKRSNGLAVSQLKLASWSMSIVLSVSLLSLVPSELSAAEALENSRLDGVTEYRMGDLEKSEASLKQAIAEAELCKSPVEVELLLDLADLYTKLGRYAEAQRCLQRAIEHLRKSEGNDSLRLIFPINRLSDLHVLAEDQRECLSLEKEALRIMQTAVSDKSPALLRQLNRLHAGLVYTGADERYVRWIYEISKVQSGRQKTEMFPVLCSEYAVALSLNGKDTQAEPIAREAVDCSEKVFDKRDSRAILTVGVLAMVLRAQGKREEADRQFDLAISRARQMPFPTQDDANRLVGLADVYFKKSMTQQSDRVYDAVLPLRRQSCFKPFYGDKDVYLRAAKVKWQAGDKEQSRKLLLEFFQDAEVVYGKRRLAMAQYLNNTGAYLKSQRFLELAASVFEKSVSILASAPDARPADQVVALKRLARTYRELGDSKRAELLFSKAQAMSEKYGIKRKVWTGARQGR
jgi:tetratricopeptide (TPR) repeat protein